MGKHSKPRLTVLQAQEIVHSMQLCHLGRAFKKQPEIGGRDHGAATKNARPEDSDPQHKLETSSTSSTLDTTGTADSDRNDSPPTPIVMTVGGSSNGRDGNGTPLLLKSVCFDLNRNEYFHDTQHKRSRTECLRCWYNNADIALFRQNSSKDAVRLLGNNKRLVSKQKQSKESERRALSLASKAQAFKQSIAETYQRSTNVRTEEECDAGDSSIDVEKLKNAYQQFEDEGVCIVGLEVFIMYGIRGQSSQQTKYILDSVKQKTRSGNQRVRNVNRHPKQRDHWMRLISQYISRPSRVFVRELARAQAAVLEAELQQEKS